MAKSGRSSRVQSTPLSQRTTQLLEWIAVPAALFAITLILASVARKSLAATAAMTVNPAEFVVDALPPWATDEIIRDVQSGLTALPPFRLDDPDLTSLVKELLPERSPWIRSVSRVEKVYPNRIRLALELRRPLARIRQGGGEDVVFDAEGIALPKSALALRAPSGDPFPRIVGGRTGPPHRPGQRVVFSELFEGISVAEDLQGRVIGSRRSRLPLLEIDVRGVPYPGNPVQSTCEIELLLSGVENSVVVEWGRSRRSPIPGTMSLSVDDRLGNLSAVLTDYPGLRGLDRVCVWRDAPSVHQMIR